MRIVGLISVSDNGIGIDRADRNASLVFSSEPRALLHRVGHRPGDLPCDCHAAWRKDMGGRRSWRRFGLSLHSARGLAALSC